ncbi:MAG: hypothetical protein JETCAE01_33750 [Anaerolineaceae bacterium]|nr:MAG: hypothetical protein JETCAE01_33750 [Anaerolineaceae bacterium]
MKEVFIISGSIAFIISILWIINLIRSGIFSSEEQSAIHEIMMANKSMAEAFKTAKIGSGAKKTPPSPETKILKMIVLALLCLVIAIIVTGILILAFDPENDIFNIVGTIASIFGILMVFIETISSAL